MSVAGDLLLLAVGSRARYTTRGPVRLPVAAACLVDDVLSGGRLPAEEVTGLARVVERRAPAAFEVTAAGLVAGGVLEPHRHLVLGLVPRHGHVVTDSRRRRAAEERLLRALAPAGPGGSRPAPADAALAALASVAGLSRRVVDLPDQRARRALATHLNSLPAAMGPDATRVVLALRRALGRLGGDDAGVPVLVPAEDRDGFGDRGGAGDGSGDGDGGDGGGGD
ncbi:GPP34 family phosphoprotein [Aquipuribacter sp. SD81]|uniref:GPP34 family phosphoprotein n=1 Tax=Aquipuribacter sp. SD81 TaxID=3127703 RepID=UPI0030196F8F